jgi:hypothetical protein
MWENSSIVASLLTRSRDPSPRLRHPSVYSCCLATNEARPCATRHGSALLGSKRREHRSVYCCVIAEACFDVTVLSPHSFIFLIILGEASHYAVVSVLSAEMAAYTARRVALSALFSDSLPTVSATGRHSYRRGWYKLVVGRCSVRISFGTPTILSLFVVFVSPSRKVVRK